MPEQYLVIGEVGFTDGPFTEEDLRHHLGNGRVRSRDRIRRVRDGRYFDLLEIIPNAADISAVRPVASDRIRRKTSDRVRAAKEKSDRVPVVAAVDESVAAVPQPETESPPSEPITPPISDPAHPQVGTTASWKRSPVVAIVASLVIAACLGIWWHGEGVMGTGDIQGTWVSQPSSQNHVKDARHPMSLVIDDRTVGIEINHHTASSPYEMELALADVVILKLATPHPSLGAKLVLARGPRNLVLLQGEQGIALVRP